VLWATGLSVSLIVDLALASADDVWYAGWSETIASDSLAKCALKGFLCLYDIALSFENWTGEEGSDEYS
jgi:hypothetical protein